MMRTLRVTVAAAADIVDVLDQSRQHFGASTRSRYARLIARALDQLRGGDPAGSLARPELGPEVRTFHLRLCRESGGADRVRNPRHLIAYTADAGQVVILRLLHERMDVPRHVPPERGEEPG